MNNNENQLRGQTPSFLRSILGMNIRSLGLHLNELKVSLVSFANIPDIKAITESWMTENDDPENNNLEGYQPIESFPRKDAKRRSGGVALYVKTGIRYKNISIATAIECCVFEVEFSVKTIVICIVYSNEKFRLLQFFPELRNCFTT